MTLLMGLVAGTYFPGVWFCQPRVVENEGTLPMVREVKYYGSPQSRMEGYSFMSIYGR